MSNLVVLVADKNAEFGIRGLLTRGHSLGFSDISSDVYVHPERDPGCFLKAHEFLRPFCDDYAHALVVFDREGCGREGLTREMLEIEVEKDLLRPDWGDRASAVIIDPELENWVWSDSPHVDRVLGWEGREPALRDWLRENGAWVQHERKPARPKEALEEALRVAHRPRSSSLYLQLAKSVSLERCTDSAFLKFRYLLARWFPRKGVPFPAEQSRPAEP